MPRHLLGPTTVLLADDDAEDRDFTRRALERTRLGADVRIVEDGAEVMDYLKHRGAYDDGTSSPRPALLLLDLRMPKKDGFTVLAEIRHDEQLRSLPVVVLSTSSAEVDVDRSYELGANSFLTKPVTFPELVDAMTTLGRYWFEHAALPSGA